MAFDTEAAAGMLSKVPGLRIVSDFMTRTGRSLPVNKRSSKVQARGLTPSMGFDGPEAFMQAALG